MPQLISLLKAAGTITDILLVLLCALLTVFSRFIYIYWTKMDKRDEASEKMIKSTLQEFEKKYFDHQSKLGEVTANLSIFKGEFIKEINEIMSVLSQIERDLSKTQHIMEQKSEDFEEQMKFVTHLKVDLTELYGSVKRIDESEGDIRKAVALHRSSLEAIKQVLTEHNKQIMELKKK